MSTDRAIPVARGHVYAFLASTLAEPGGPHFKVALESTVQSVAIAAADLLASEAPEDIELAPAENPPQSLDLRPVVDQLAKPREEIVRQHQDVFGLLIGKAAPPYETEYCRSTLTFYRSQQLADVTGFYQAFGLEQSPEEPERPDHISLELEFMARLIEKQLAASRRAEAVWEEKAFTCWEAQQKFFEAHLAWWIPAFAELLRRASPPGLYSALSAVLASFIPSERALLGVRPAGHLEEPVISEG